MKAIVYHRYGGPEVVSLAEVAKPAPKDNEVLIRIHATTVSSGDWRARSLDMPGIFKILGRLFFGVFGPRKPVLGTELAGVVETVGKDVTRFKPGDEVIAYPSAGFGSHAEYRTMPEDGLIVAKPANLNFEEAAALSFGATTALNFLRDKAALKAGERVLVIGASGAVGTAAVQIAKHFGAEVTGVCSTANVALVASLGADRVIDYKTEDFAASGETWDVILDTTGTAPMARVEAALAPGGRLAVVNGTFAQSAGLERARKGSGKTLVAGVTKTTPDDMRLIAALAESGELRPVIDRIYPLADAAEAHAYVDTGRKRGAVVLVVRQGRDAGAPKTARAPESVAA